MMEAQVMCRNCQQVFPADASLDDEVTCPVCETTAQPLRVMRMTGPPSLEIFKRNFMRANRPTED